MCEDMPMGAHTGQEGSVHLHLGNADSLKLPKCLPQQLHAQRSTQYLLPQLRRGTKDRHPVSLPRPRESLRNRQYKQQAHLELISIPSRGASSFLSP